MAWPPLLLCPSFSGTARWLPASTLPLKPTRGEDPSSLSVFTKGGSSDTQMWQGARLRAPHVVFQGNGNTDRRLTLLPCDTV